MLKKEYEILEIFAQKPWKKCAYREIKEYIHKNSKSYVFGILKKFVKQRILKEEKAGNVVLYSLDTSSEKALIYAGIVSEHRAWNKKSLPYDDITRLMEKMPTEFFVLLITGSYASGKQRKKSDLDMVIICDNAFETKKIYAELQHYADTSIPPIHLYAFTEKEFALMLNNNEANYGKEIAKNCLIISGGRIYFKIMSEAIKNGFNGQEI